MITINDIPLIEKALDIKLYDFQIKYIFEGENTFSGRRSGRTMSYIIKYLLTDRSPLKLKDIYKYSDIPWNTRYSRDWFVKEFLYIKDKLDSVGLKTVEVIK